MSAVQRRSGAWRVVARQDISELWSSAKGLTVLFGLALLLSGLSYLASIDAAINLLDARESVGVVVQTAIGLGTLSAMLVSADAISGERERGTLEALLVTPLDRSQLVLGKLVAATTMWAASLLIALPYVAVMATGPGVAADAVVVLLVAGGLVAASLTALGLAISAFAMSNRVSLVTSVVVLVVLAAPSQLPAIAGSARLGTLLITANPVSAGLQMAHNLLVLQEPWSNQWRYLISPTITAIALSALAVSLSGRLRLGGAQ